MLDKSNHVISLMLIAGLLVLLALWPNCTKDKATNSQNRPPVISSITADPDSFMMESSSLITATATDPDGNGLNYNWESRGELLPLASESNTLRVTNCCPVSEITRAMVISIIDDGQGGETRDSVPVWILPLNR